MKFPPTFFQNMIGQGAARECQHPEQVGHSQSHGVDKTSHLILLSGEKRNGDFHSFHECVVDHYWSQ